MSSKVQYNASFNRDAKARVELYLDLDKESNKALPDCPTPFGTPAKEGHRKVCTQDYVNGASRAGHYARILAGMEVEGPHVGALRGIEASLTEEREGLVPEAGAPFPGRARSHGATHRGRRR